ncbi:Serine acetyltransferase [Roseimaritima multifibrata]|uniref:Serine acetyltransferase n=1 Tax=Roseimaritima multifibrata TaxID=1930274 RepID=A0A517MMJ6_9BACT|nr:Serine acetyltransferase [Roseimaritima multifibrata]
MPPPLPAGDKNKNPPDIGFLALLREDKRTHYDSIWEQGFWAIAVHRFGNWRMDFKYRIARFPLSIAYKVLNKAVEWFCGISLPYTVLVGRRVRIWHHGGMILHGREIGDDCQIRQCTTLGVARAHDNLALPSIGTAVDIGCNVCILGNVRIGDRAVIGAGAVVLNDVPADHIAVGVPARNFPNRDQYDTAPTGTETQNK